MNRDEAMVETYRDLLRVKAGLADAAAVPTGPTPGAGRGCRPDRLVPGKRLRNWHRRYGQGLTLRAFVRGLASQAEESRVAKLWLASKGARP